MEVAERIRVHSASLTTAERRVAEAILRAPQAVGFGTVADLADAASVGAASVVRLASKLGFEGYSDLQASIQHDLLRQLRPAVERMAGPRAGEVAPLGQVPRGLSQPIDRAVVSPERRAAQCAPDTLGRIDQLLLEPPAERVIEQPCRRGFGQHLEERIDACLHRTLPQQIGAETMDRADVCLLEAREREVEQCATRRVVRFGRAGRVEALAEPELQLAGGLFREGHRHDFADVGAPLGEDRNDPAHELGRLSGPRGGLDDQRFVEGGGDQVAGAGVGQREERLGGAGRVLVAERRLLAPDAFDEPAALTVVHEAGHDIDDT